MKEKRLYTISIVLCLIDQLLKIFIIHNFDIYQKVTILKNFFSIYYLQNKGAAFSTFSGMIYLFIGIGIFLLYLLSRYIRKTKNFSILEGLSLGFIMGGIAGNLIDRILHHYVIDYLSFTIFGYSFAVFNLADIFIVLGSFLLIIEVYRGEITWKNLNIKKN